MTSQGTHKPRFILILTLLIFNLLCAPLARVFAQTQPANAAAVVQLPPGVERVTSVEGITEYKLPNGLRVLLFPDPTKPTVTVNITYMVGSRHEGYGETGMAHLLEHMLFKGSPKHPDINTEMTKHGAFSNATTSFDRTNYFESFAATEENLKWALELEADRMINSNVAKKDLDSEMTVVRNEFESGENDPVRVMIQRMLSTAYLWHNYGKVTIGARSDIENVTIDRLQAFYRNYYQPDNAVLLVAGKFDEGKTLALIHQFFGPIQRPARTLQKTYTAEPVQDGERAVTLRRVGDVQAVSVVYHVPAGAHEDFAALSILSHIMSNAPSGRLYKALVETKKASSVFGAGYQQREPGVAFFGAEVSKDASLETARDVLLETIEKFGSAPPTAEEVERARTAYLTGIERTLTAAERVGLSLSNWIAMGDWRLFFLNRDRLRKVTPEDVQRVAQRYLKPSNRTLGMFIPTSKPERAEIPALTEAELAAMLKDYKGDAAVAMGEAFDPSPANIESRTERVTLPGGIKAALLPKKTRGSTVIVNLTFRFGDEKSLMNRVTAGNYAGRMLRRGTLKHTRQQITDEFNRLKATAFVSGGVTSAGAGIETRRENLPAVLRLVAEILREPAFPANEFETLKQQDLTAIEQNRNEPESLAYNLYNRHLYSYPKGDIRYVPTPDERIASVKALTLEEVKKFYADFYGASNGYLSIVGDFDPAEMKKLITELFGNWKSPGKYTRISNNYKNAAPLNQTLPSPDKANAFIIAGYHFEMRDDDPDYPALVLGNYILGGGATNSRLWTRIREKEGLSYGVGSNIFAHPIDRFATFSTTAIYAPQNAAKLEAALKEELARAIKDGFTSEELETAKSGYFQQQQLVRAQDSSLASKLELYLYYDRTFALDAQFEKRIAALTPAEVNAAIRRHITPDKLIIIKAGDFK
jgi:zinc protease